MDFNKNYYATLGLPKDCSEKDIKKSYYKLSFIHHPDKGGDSNYFAELTEAYDILIDESRKEYDRRSRFGSEYDENSELLKNDYVNPNYGYDGQKIDRGWKENDLNIVLRVEDDFDGGVEYERWVICKDCNGKGRDTKSKIEIKDEFGNILKTFQGSDGCDFCEGTGKNHLGNICLVCNGVGEVGWSSCKSCNGNRRILGNQKLTGIKFPVGEKKIKVESMGHFDKFQIGMVGHLWIVKK